MKARPTLTDALRSKPRAPCPRSGSAGAGPRAVGATQSGTLKGEPSPSLKSPLKARHSLALPPY